MRSKTFSILSTLTLATIFLSACSAIARHHAAFVGQEPKGPTSVASDSSDPISGAWNVSFYVHNSTTPATFTFKLEGTKVTGTAYSEHTGPGTIRDGKWEDGKLSFTLDFKKHESIAIKGALVNGKLSGTFSTEGFTEKWDATKK